jgi:hypothetical protein
VAAARAAVAAARPFESRLKRPYFHVRPLDGGQLATWAAYLTAAEAAGDDAATEALYERALVACASYPGARARTAGAPAAALARRRPPAGSSPCALLRTPRRPLTAPRLIQIQLPHPPPHPHPNFK